MQFHWSNTYSSLSEHTKFRLNDISKIKDYSNSEIQEKKISKKLSKYIVVLDYFEKTIIVLTATSGRISIISFTSVTRVPIGAASAGFSLAFDNQNNKETVRNNKK